MADSNFRAHYNMDGKTHSIDFSIPTKEISEKTKNESAASLIKEKHPEFSGKTIVISKVDIFK